MGISLTILENLPSSNASNPHGYAVVLRSVRVRSSKAFHPRDDLRLGEYVIPDLVNMSWNFLNRFDGLVMDAGRSMNGIVVEIM